MSTNDNLDNRSSPDRVSSRYNGTVVPNRIFVGGIASNITEAELHSVFSKYGNVKATKIIIDKAGISKGYGFVTFETEEEAQRIQKEVDGIVLKDRKLDIAPAIKKQSFSRIHADPGQMISNSTIIYPSTVPQSYNSTALLNGNDNLYLPQAPYPLYPQIFFPHQQYYQAPSGAAYPAQYVFAVPAASNVYAYGSAVPHSGAHSNDGTESSVAEVSSEGGKAAYSKQNISTPVVASDYENSRMSSTKPDRISNGSSHRSSNGSSSTGYPSITGSTFFPMPSQYPHQPVLTKTANGATVIAYHSPIIMAPPTLLHVRDPSVGDHDMTESFFSSPVATGTLTPPPTPFTPYKM